MTSYNSSGPTSTCKLFFHGWEQLKESGYSLEGSGKNARHLKFRSPQEIEPDEVAQMVVIARAAVGK